MLDLTKQFRIARLVACFGCHPWLLDPGNPCRDDGVSQTFVYKDERWS